MIKEQEDLGSKITKAPQENAEKLAKIDASVNELVPSLKAGLLVEKFKESAKQYRNQSWWLLTISIAALLLMGWFGVSFVNTILSHLNSHQMVTTVILDIITRGFVIFFIIYAISLLTRTYNRTRNLMENYNHKAALGDYYVAMQPRIEAMLKEAANDQEIRQSLLKYMQNLSIEFTKEIAIPPRAVHSAYRPTSSKWRAKFNKGPFGAEAASEQSHQ